MKLLVVEDEKKTAHILKQGLEENGYEVVLAFNGEQALAHAESIHFDLALLDVVIPKINGLEICGKLKAQNPELPVIMLTALGLVSDKIKGFNAGSDDYIVKPFDFEELLIRIKVALRRIKKKEVARNIIEYAGIVMDLDNKEVYREGKFIDLAAKEYLLLEFFMKNIDKLVTREDIARAVWNLNFETGTNYIEVYVSYLRNKIEKGYNKKLIHNRKKIGYIFREEQ